jgi:hypothetical protein
VRKERQTKGGGGGEGGGGWGTETCAVGEEPREFSERGERKGEAMYTEGR